MPRRKNTAIKPYKLKSGKKKYMFKLYLGMKGTKKIETTRRGFSSYEEADAVYKKMAAQNAQDFIKEKQITFDELYQKWLPFYARDVKESTLWKTETMYKTHLKDAFGNQYIDQITTAEIADYFLKLSAKYVNYKVLFWYMRRILSMQLTSIYLTVILLELPFYLKRQRLKSVVIQHIIFIVLTKSKLF